MFLPYIDLPQDLAHGKLKPIEIHPFGLLVATGVLIGSWLIVRRGEKYGLPRQKMESFLTYGLAFGFVISHVLDQLMYYPKDVLARPYVLLLIWTSLSSYGGFIGGVVGAFVYKAVKKEKILPYLEHILAIFPVGWIFGRAGCSVAHDHIGRASTSFLAVNFPGGPRFDLGLLEMLITIPIAAFMLWFASKPRAPGVITGTLAIIYAPIRFPLDALRATDIAHADARYLGLTPGQWLSVALLAVGVLLLVRARSLPKTMPAPLPTEKPVVTEDATGSDV